MDLQDRTGIRQFISRHRPLRRSTFLLSPLLMLLTRSWRPLKSQVLQVAGRRANAAQSNCARHFRVDPAEDPGWPTTSQGCFL